MEELRVAFDYDYVVVNADRTEALADVAAIVDAESLRPRRNPEWQAQLDDLGRQIERLAAAVPKKAQEV